MPSNRIQYVAVGSSQTQWRSTVDQGTPMGRYKLEVESDGNLGIYYNGEGSQRELWLGNILEPESPNPAFLLGIPIGILGLRKILALFDKWKAGDHAASGTRQPSPRSAKCRSGTRKWRMSYRAGK